MNLYVFPPYVIRVSGSGEGYDLINTETGVTELSNHPSLPRCIVVAKESSGFFSRMKREQVREALESMGGEIVSVDFTR